MRTPRLHWLTAGGHSFHPVYEVCAVCGVTRPQYQANGEPKCAGGQSGFGRFISLTMFRIRKALAKLPQQTATTLGEQHAPCPRYNCKAQSR